MKIYTLDEWFERKNYVIFSPAPSLRVKPKLSRAQKIDRLDTQIVKKMDRIAKLKARKEKKVTRHGAPKQ